MYQITAIPAFDDNYIWAINSNNHCVIVDPGDATPVISYLKSNNLKLTDILITHHHKDHIGGISELCAHYEGVNVYAPNTNRFPQVTNVVSDRQKFVLNSINKEVTVLDVPGHTIDHVAYQLDDNLFVGDTLFSAGCGRLFEGTPKQMRQSLEKLSRYPSNYKVYCAHEYTLANLEFAKYLMPSNIDIENYIQQAKALRANNIPTIPTSLQIELTINPFLLTEDPELINNICQHFNLHSTPDSEETFKLTRELKDSF